MKTNQALNINHVNSAPKSDDFTEHYLPLIRQRAIYMDLRQDKGYINFKRMMDQIQSATN